MTSKGRPRSREYDMRPNLNASEGAQGTLFSGGQRAGRGHRGYTPERMAEVKAAVNVVGPKLPASTKAPGYELMGGGPKIPTPKGERKGREAQGRRRAYNEMARSTVDVNDLPQPLTVKVLHGKQAGLGSTRGRSTTLGTYESEQQGNPQLGNVRRHGIGEIRVREQFVDAPKSDRFAQAHQGALIHELGHAADDKKRGGIPMNNHYEFGKSEGKADEFGARNFRDRRGDGAKFDYPDQGRNNEQKADFRGGYEHGRGGRTVDPQVMAGTRAYAAARQQPSLFPEDNTPLSMHPAHKAVLQDYAQGVTNQKAADRRQWRRG